MGKKAGAVYAVSGSVSEFGDRISVDVRLIDVREGKVLPGVFVQGRGRENLDAILAQLRADILIRIASDERIVRVEFKGNRKIEASAINQVLKSAPGNIFTDADLSADIKAIFKMGYFDDVTAEVTDVAEGKVITFVVEEKPLITEIRIQGNKALKKDDIEGAMSVRTRQTVNPEKLKTDMEKIKTLYDGKGYYNAEIRYTIEKAGERDVRIVVDIVENEKLFIRNISFEGNRTFTTKELKNMMTTNEWGIFHFFTDSGLLKKDQLKQDVGKLNAFYLNNGFINAQIGEPVITYDRDGIHIKIPISEGKQFRVGKVAITGDELTIPRADLMAKLQIRKKDFYDREAIMKDMDTLTQACNDEGYAERRRRPAHRAAGEDPDGRRDLRNQQGEARLFQPDQHHRQHQDEGQGDPPPALRGGGGSLQPDQAQESYMALNQLRYFEEIDFQSEKGPDETLTDVNIRVKEKPTGMFSIGAGYSALDHAIVSAQVCPAEPLRPRPDPEPQGEPSAPVPRSTTSPSRNPGSSTCPSGANSISGISTASTTTYNLDSKGFGATFGYPLWPVRDRLCRLPPVARTM